MATTEPRQIHAGPLHGVPMMMLPEAGRTLAATWAARIGADPKATPTADSKPAPRSSMHGSYDAGGNWKPYALVDGVAVLRIDRPVIMCGGSEAWYYGGCSTDELVAAAETARADPAVRAMLLDLNCPGGTVAGSDDVSRSLTRLAAEKPLYAIAHDLCASMAVQYAAAALEVVATPTARLGWIGTVVVYYDDSARYAEEGIRAVPIASHPDKAVGHPGVPISDSFVASQQRELNAHLATYLGAIEAGRGKKGFTAAKALALNAAGFAAAEAVTLGIADRVVGFSDYLAEIAKRHSSRTVSISQSPSAASAAKSINATSRTKRKGHPMSSTKTEDQYAADPTTDPSETETETVIVTEEETPMDEEDTAKKSATKTEAAATLAQLRALSPDDATFVLDAFDRKLTLAAASLELIATLRAKANAKATTQTGKAPASAPLPSVRPSAAAADTEPKTYAEAVKRCFAELKITTPGGSLRRPDRKNGGDVSRAYYEAKQQFPELHAEWRKQGFQVVQF